MAKPNPECPKCHGSGWALKPGTQTKAPCLDCVIQVQLASSIATKKMEKDNVAIAVEQMEKDNDRMTDDGSVFLDKHFRPISLNRR